MEPGSGTSPPVRPQIRDIAALAPHAKPGTIGTRPSGGSPMTEDSVLDAAVVVIDSIAALEASDAGAIVVTGSHGGVSAAVYALSVPIRGVVFNDAGLGKDAAGIAALGRLDAAGVPALAVSHESARIGDAGDTLRSGIVSHVNHEAARRGVAPGQTTQEAVRRLAEKALIC